MYDKKKKAILYTILIVMTTLPVALPFETDTRPSDNKMLEWTMWTKAVCNEENYCIDVQITCEGDKVVDITPVAEGIYFSSDWEDPRPEEFRNKLC